MYYNATYFLFFCILSCPDINHEKQLNSFAVTVPLHKPITALIAHTGSDK